MDNVYVNMDIYQIDKIIYVENVIIIKETAYYSVQKIQ